MYCKYLVRSCKSVTSTGAVLVAATAGCRSNTHTGCRGSTAVGLPNDTSAQATLRERHASIMCSARYFRRVKKCWFGLPFLVASRVLLDYGEILFGNSRHPSAFSLCTRRKQKDLSPAYTSLYDSREVCKTPYFQILSRFTPSSRTCSPVVATHFHSPVVQLRFCLCELRFRSGQSQSHT
jgi:hypothetical protein